MYSHKTFFYNYSVIVINVLLENEQIIQKYGMLDVSGSGGQMSTCKISTGGWRVGAGGASVHTKNKL